MSIQISEKMRACIDLCTTCSSICVETVPHCLCHGDNDQVPDHVNTLLDCADLCRVAAEFMTRQSPLHPAVCAVCADACDRSADACERLGEDDAALQRCATICRQCAASCREMALATRTM